MQKNPHPKRSAISIALLALGALAFNPAQATVTDADILNDAATKGDVVSFGLGTQGQRFSPMNQINTKTVKNLVPAWSMSFGGEKQRGQESQPVIHNGKMFVTASYSRLFAVDAKTGKKLWKYEHRLPDGIMPCCDVINRGAALHGDLVIFATLDAQLVALNQNTGKVVWKEKLGDYAAGYSATAAPIVAKGKLITGVSGGEFGVVGRIDARDPQTGKLLWTRPTVEGHMGYKYDADGKQIENGISGTTNATWEGDLWKTGGAATWNGATYDPETNLIFAGTGNPARGTATCAPATTCSRPPPWPSTPTPARSSGTTRTPARRLGLRRVNEFISFDYKDPKTGKVIKAGGKADRNGFFFVNDRTNGKLLNAFPFVKKITWATGYNLETGRPNYIEEGRPGDPTAGADGKKGKVVFSAPSFLGGKNQQMGYSPQTGLFYVPANEWSMDIWNEPVAYKKGAAYLGAGFTIKAIHDDYIGVLRAWTRPPARSCGRTRTTLPCGAACCPPAAAWSSMAPPKAC
jgi:alcohol dehydrogenase (cytochrome c)